LTQVKLSFSVLGNHTWDVKARHPIDLEPVLKQEPLLQTVYSMRRDLSRLWTRSTIPSDQLVEQLREWIRRAESSGIAPLQKFSQELIRLA
jgi:stearoyl-CoA desaturase (Delta-9 desaturase)